MSDVSKGAARVRAVEKHFHRHLFRTAIVSRSGQRRGARADSLAFDGDLLALGGPGQPDFVVEVGGLSKRVAVSMAELTAQPLPAGFVPLVVRFVGGRGPGSRWRWHLQEAAYDSLDALLDGREPG